MEPTTSYEPSHPVPIGPSSDAERIETLDLLRGVGVLGILAMNIYAFSMPGAAYFDPLVAGGESALSLAIFAFTRIFADSKFYSLFSMIFGAGIILFTTRLEARGVAPKRPYYRRVLWLLVFGLAHSLLLWNGDILFPYAWCGILLYPLRRKRTKRLAVTGTVFLLVTAVAGIGFGTAMEYGRSLAEARTASADSAAIAAADTFGIASADSLAGPAADPSTVASGDTLDALPADTSAAAARDSVGTEDEVHGLEEMWEGFREEFAPTRDEVEEEIAIHRGGYLTILVDRAKEAGPPLIGMLFFAPFGLGGIMLIGMALFKAGILTGDRPSRFYKRMAVWGYATGVPIGVLGVYLLFGHDFDVVHRFREGGVVHLAATAGMVAGNLGFIIWLQKRGVLQGLQARLRAVGRMAFTNYLMQSLVCTTLFYGYGMGWFGRLSRPEQVPVVVALWVVQLLWSPWWLRRYRFGPAEWLWRSLTYGSRQPMRR